ncbi:hypothetical protein B0H14DRAFT_1597488 [Mycena olivaceomarginata]|nr:hypothetical protein B0H14DRAFT_1597488 [Mycena olivaceomarginata]
MLPRPSIYCICTPFAPRACPVPTTHPIADRSPCLLCALPAHSIGVCGFPPACARTPAFVVPFSRSSALVSRMPPAPASSTLGSHPHPARLFSALPTRSTALSTRCITFVRPLTAHPRSLHCPPPFVLVPRTPGSLRRSRVLASCTYDTHSFPAPPSRCAAYPSHAGFPRLHRVLIAPSSMLALRIPDALRRPTRCISNSIVLFYSCAESLRPR